MIRVAIADDSTFTCRLLQDFLERDGDCEIVGMAHDAAATRELVRRERPDVLTLDLEMPGGHGLDLLNDIVTRTAVPVVVISGITKRAAATTLRALELGAVDFVLKYTPGAPVAPAAICREIVTKVKTAASAKPASPLRMQATAVRPPERPPRHDPERSHAARIVVIGASTGGPQALRDIVAQLPEDYATPCIIVQHLPPNFAAAFAAQLARSARLPVDVAEDTDRATPGRLLVTPGGRHLLLRSASRIELRPVTDKDTYRPSIDCTMTSAAEVYRGSAAGVVLSGMGYDGAEGLRTIRASGGVGYVQDPSTCVIGSMPSRAIERAGADYVAPPERIGVMLARRGRP